MTEKDMLAYILGGIAVLMFAMGIVLAVT